MTFAGGKIFLSMFCCDDDPCGNFNMSWLFGAVDCLIKGGEPIGATFFRTGDVVTTGGTFGTNEVVTLNGKMYHHGQVTDTIPVYDVSPLVRPTAPDVYDTAASQPNPDKHGLNWEFSDPKNAWVWDLLDGRADGPNIWTSPTIVQSGTTIVTDNGDGSFTIFAPDADVGTVTSSTALVIGERYESSFNSVVRAEAASLRVGGASQRCFFEGGDQVCRRTSAGTSLFAVRESFCDLDFTINYVRQLSHATGTLNIKGLSVVPSVTEWQTTGDFNILSGATGNQILYIESGTGLICATDGTNTCKSSIPYTAGADHTVKLSFSAEGRMRIDVDGNLGASTDFAGTFSPGETLKWGLDNEDVWSIGDVCGNVGLAELVPVEVIQGVEPVEQGAQQVIQK